MGKIDEGLIFILSKTGSGQTFILAPVSAKDMIEMVWRLRF